jgi:hypothetical protein
MSKPYTFEKELLKNLVTVFLTNGCNFESSFPDEFKKPIKLFFYDTIPMMQLGDGFSYIEAVFTKEAVNSFRKNFSHLRLGNLRDRLLKITKWSFHFKQRQSENCANSFENLAVYLVV